MEYISAAREEVTEASNGLRQVKAGVSVDFSCGKQHDV